MPFENFVGRAEIIFFSIDEGASRLADLGMAVAVRWQRMFRPIR